jgi:O-antigen/teichoic acid export membrane protein
VTATAPAARAFRPSPFLRDVISSGLTAAGIMLSLVAVTGWLASGLGPARFAVYALSRRLLTAVTSFSTVPVGVALTRALAIETRERERLTYLVAGTIFVLVPNLALFAIALAAPGLWSRVLLTDAGNAPVLVATMLLIVGMAVFTVVLARYRGTDRIGRANVWQVWALALGPAAVALPLARSGRVDVIVLLTAVVLLTSAVPVARWLLRAGSAGIRWSDVRPRLNELLRYGVPRVPGGVAFGGLMAIGPFLAPYFGTLREAGFLVAGQSILRVAEGATSAFSLVALPKVAALRARQQHHFLRDRVEDMISVVLHLGLFGTVQLLIWSDEIATVWLGPAYREAVPIIRILMAGVVPYLGYAVLRTTIDGLEEKAVNTHHMYAACAVTLVLSLAFGAAGFGAPGLAVAGAAGFLVLGLLTVRHLWTSLQPAGEHLAVRHALWLNLLLGAATLGLRHFLVTRLAPRELLAVGMATAAVAFGTYLLALRRLGVRWVAEIEQRLRPRERAR